MLFQGQQQCNRETRREAFAAFQSVTSDLAVSPIRVKSPMHRKRGLAYMEVAVQMPQVGSVKM